MKASSDNPFSSHRLMGSLWLSLLLCIPTFVLADISLRVGVYHNPPKFLMNKEGRASGILGDLLNAMAERHQWELEPVACTWDQCLRMLERGEIDLMPDVAHSDIREQRFDFHEEPALLSWSQVYEARGQQLTSLLDLEGKRLAVLAGSIQEAYLKDLTEGFQLKVHWVYKNSFQSGFEAVARGQADAVAANYFFGDHEAARLGLNATPILFQPSRLFYASSQNRFPDVLAAIDSQLREWKADSDSPYFEILHGWGVSREQPAAPVLLWWILAALGLALLAVLCFSQLLRRKVFEKTRRLRASEARLGTILDSVEAYIYIKGTDLRYQYVNRKVCDFFDLSPGHILGRTDAEMFGEQPASSFGSDDETVIESGEQLALEEVLTAPGDGKRHQMLTTKLPLRHPDGTIYALCGISTDITRHREIQEQIHQLAFYDPLTGLANRRLLQDRLRHALAGRVNTGYEGALLLIDIDNFKVLNETQGHEAGDGLLKQVAGRLQAELRDMDSAARLGADEFVIIAEDLSDNPQHALQEVRNLARQLQQTLANPYQIGSAPYVTTVSIGIAMFSDGDQAEELLKGVDLALFEAKESGRDSVRFFNSAMQTEVQYRTELEVALRRAIENGSLELYVQPQIDSTGQPVGMEALLRWHDPERGWVSPAEFVPVAESSGLIIPLGQWVLEEACRTLARWAAMPAMEHLTLAVNISPVQFRHHRFVAHLEDCLRQSGAEPSRLELEVTENLLIDDMVYTVERMNLLRARGLRFALDDFGTGYASLGYLKQLPLYRLKIDKSFVADLLEDTNDEAIIRAIIALGKTLELNVIAEGVETQAQEKRLRALGCPAFQGFLFGLPESVSGWEARLGRGQLNA